METIDDRICDKEQDMTNVLRGDALLFYIIIGAIILAAGTLGLSPFISSKLAVLISIAIGVIIINLIRFKVRRLVRSVKEI